MLPKMLLMLTAWAAILASPAHAQVGESAKGQTNSGQIGSILGGANVSVFRVLASYNDSAGTPQKAKGKTRRRVIAKVSKPALKSAAKKPAGKKTVVPDKPIAPEEWINENASAAVDERKIADGEPLLFLSEGFLNSRITGCSAPVFPAVARKRNLKEVRLRVFVTIAKYGGVLDAQVLEGDDIFRASVYESLGSMQFRQTYFIGEPVRIQGILEFRQHNKDSYNMISCRDAVSEAELPTIIDGGEINAKTVACETPEFPVDAKTAGLKEVAARVQIVIDEKGNVIYAKTLNGHLAFGVAAEKAALKTTFRKSIIMNNLVKVRGEMVFRQTADNSIVCEKIPTT